MQPRLHGVEGILDRATRSGRDAVGLLGGDGASLTGVGRIGGLLGAGVFVAGAVRDVVDFATAHTARGQFHDGILQLKCRDRRRTCDDQIQSINPIHTVKTMHEYCG